MKRWHGGAVLLAVLWLFIRGVPLAPVPITAELLVGLAIATPLSFAFRRFYRQEVAPFATLRSLPYALWYVVVFLFEVVTANLDVAYRVLHPRMPIEPDVITLPLRVETDLAITTIANSITLTPGTLTMDYDEERHALYIHAMVAHDREAVVAPIRRWEDLALVIFDEQRSPDDPVPGGADRGD